MFEKKLQALCLDCGKPESYGSEEMGSIESQCVCDSKRVICDCCGHLFLQKDMSMNNMFLALCKLCNEHEPYMMDNVAVARFRTSDWTGAMLCVQQFDEKLQLTMKVYHMGLSIIFPAMTKQELFFRWFQDHPGFREVIEADFLFNAAILRLKDDYLTDGEVTALRRQFIEAGKAASLTGCAV